MRRVIEPERLDSLSSSDPEAIRSRADLRRLNAIMNHPRILANAFSRCLNREAIGARSLRLCELGAGDGTLLLKLARSPAEPGVRVEADLIDRLDLVSAETRKALADLDWCARPVLTDAMAWLNGSTKRFDVIFANLFLHHFQDDRLCELFERVTGMTGLFIACEPRRSAFTLAASRLLWLAGCNAVTRHDGVVSVRAGFAGKELSALWGRRDGWRLSEYPAGLFSHCFIAKRHV